jgi:hypothetical protein
MKQREKPFDIFKIGDNIDSLPERGTEVPFDFASLI